VGEKLTFQKTIAGKNRNVVAAPILHRRFRSASGDNGLFPNAESRY